MTAVRLVEAVQAGDVSRVREIVSEDPATVSARPAGQPSAILMAAYTGNSDLLAILSEHAELDAAEAAVTGRVERLAELLERDPGCVARYSGDGWTPLHLAAFAGHADAVARLLDAGADPLAVSTNPTANTALHAAIAGRTDLATIRLLVERGGDVNRRGGGGSTPLHLAATRGSLPVIELLLERGADAGERTDDGRTAADLALERGHPEAAERLKR